MRRVLKIVLVIGVLALLAGGVVGAVRYFSLHPDQWERLLVELELKEAGPARQEGIVASGFIEATQVAVSSQVGGRVLAVHADEGEEVEAGQVLVELDPALLDAQIEIAQAEIEAAEAQLAQIKAGVKPETIAVAEAELEQAKVARDVARQAWEDAQALLENPQELEMQVAIAAAQVRVAEHQLAQAEALRDAAQVGADAFEQAMEQIGPGGQVEIAHGPLPALAPLLQKLLSPEVYKQVMSGQDGTYTSGNITVVVSGGIATVYKKVGMPFEAHLAPIHYWQSNVAVNQAQAGLKGAKATLYRLNQLKENPVALQAQVNAAQAEYETAKANVQVAQAALDALKAGATEEEIAVAEAQVEQARRALASLEAQRELLTLTAPLSGLVLERVIQPGELAAPGATLLTIADLSQVTLTIYVPETAIGRVRVGQRVAVTVDTFPDRTFEGTVARIADEAEFTPRNVQTKEERVNLVFAVEVRIPNPDGALKPGMPADAVIVEGES